MTVVMSTSPPLLPTLLFFLFLVALLVLYLFLVKRKARKLGGRTTKEFQSDTNVWEILDLWAGATKYKLMQQDENSRTYERRGIKTPFMVPMVRVTWTGNGYILEAWLLTRRFFRILLFGFLLPREMVINVKTLLIGWGDWHPLDARHIASKDVNVLIEMLDAGIEPIP